MRSASLISSEKYLILALLVLGALAIYAAFEPTALLAAAIAIALLLLLAFRGYHFGIVILVALAPFLGVRFQLPPFREGLLGRVFPDGIDLALGNAVGLLLLAVFVADLLLRYLVGRKAIHLRLPGAWFAAAFIIASFLSIQNADDVLLSAKYVFYPIAFSILVFAYLPIQHIRTRRMLTQIVRVAYGTGVAAAGLGLLSLILLPAAGLLKRATVFGIAGVFPLGTNHNLLAEVLIAVLPYGFFLAIVSRSPRTALWYRAGSFLMLSVAVLTFARTAWIAIVLQIMIYVVLGYRHRLRTLARPALLLLLLASPLILYMVYFSRSAVVAGSTEARLTLTNFALFQFFQHPIVGAGAGTFVERLGGTLDFTQDFGDPLDAHGFVQKIGAEAGTFGLFTFFLFIGWILRDLYMGWKRIPAGAGGEKRLMLMMLVSVSGTLCYQLFNTSYYNAKMWLPIGLALAARELTKRKH